MKKLMNKRIVALVLSFVMVLGMLPALTLTANAASNTNLYVAGKQFIKNGSLESVSVSGVSVSYDSAANTATITLNGVNTTEYRSYTAENHNPGTTGYSIDARNLSHLYIVLADGSTNNFELSWHGPNTLAFLYATCPVTISGNGTLNATVNNISGKFYGYDLDRAYGIRCTSGTVTICNDAKVNISLDVESYIECRGIYASKLLVSNAELSIGLSNVSTFGDGVCLNATTTLESGSIALKSSKGTTGSVSGLTPSTDDDNWVLYTVAPHTWKYAVSGNVLKAWCSNTAHGCAYQGEANATTLTITAADTTFQTETTESTSNFGINKTTMLVSHPGASVSDSLFSVLTGLTASEITYKGTGNTAYEATTEPPFKAGTYQATVTVGSYTLTDEFTIAKADLDYTAPTAKEGLEANGDEQALVAPGSVNTMWYFVMGTYDASQCIGTMQYSLDGETWSTTVPTAAVPGTYNVMWRIVENNSGSWYDLFAGCYNDVEGETLTVKIQGLDMTGDVSAEGYTGTYDGGAHSITVTKPADATVTYSTDGVNYTANNPTFTDAGNYTVYYCVTRNGYYSVTGSAKVVINKKPVTELTIAVEDIEYTGERVSPDILIKDGETELVEGVDYILNDDVDVCTVDTYKTTIVGKGNYTGDTTVYWSITSKQIGIEWGNTDLIYNGTAQAPAATATGVFADDIISLVVEGTAVNAGTYTAKVTAITGEYGYCYELPEDTEITFTIGQKELTPAISGSVSKAYDGTVAFPQDNSLTITLDGVVGSDEVQATASYAYGDVNVGTTKVDASNITLSGKDADNYKLKSTTASANVGEITKATPKYDVPSGLTATYGDTLETVTLPNGFSWEADKSTAVGNVGTRIFKVTYTPEDTANFNTVTGIEVSVAVTAAPASVENAPAANNGLIYNKTAQALISAGTANGGEMQYSLDGENFSDAIPVATDAGSYIVYYKIVGDENHNDSQRYEVTSTIEKKDVTVSATVPYRIYGDSLDVDTSEVIVTFNGIVDGDDVGYVVTSAYYHAHTVTDNAPVTVEYRVTGEDAANYSFPVYGDWVPPIYPVEAVGRVLPKNIADVGVALGAGLTYNGTEQTQEVIVPQFNGEDVTFEVSGNKQTNAGDYTLTVTGNGNYTGEVTLDWCIAKADPAIGTVTAGVVNDTLETSAIELNRSNTAVNGALSVDAGQELKLGDNQIAYTFTPEDPNNYKIVTGVVTVTVKDTIAPTGKVYFDERNGWESFVHTVTFGLFYKNEVTVKVDATDAFSGVAKIGYIESATQMSLDEVKAAENWTAMPENGVGVTVEDTKQFIYYVRITDNAGNVTYLSTDGAEYDTTAPVISGVEDGKTYYTTQKVTVTEKNVESITVNDESATTEITLDGNVDKTYTIAVKDKAGNETKVTVTMKPISELSKPIDELTKDNVNSGDESTVDGVKAAVAAVDTTNATDAEKQALKDIADKAAELKKVIDDTKAEIARINEELNKYSEATVNSDDAEALEQLGKDIKALTDGDNLTDAERTALTEAADDVAQMQKIIEDTATENDRISDAVDGYDLATVTSDDKEDLEQLLADIEKQLESTNLTDDEISELNGDKKAVEDLLAKIEGTDELIDKLIGDVDGYSDDTVKSTDEDAIEQIIEDIDALLDTENLTEEEKNSLEEAKAKAEDLLDTIEDAAKDTDTENTVKVEDVTAENVTPDDKTDLEKAKADLEKALEDNGGNYTENEKKAIEDEIKRIDDALEVIGNVEAVEELIGKLPDTIKKDDEAAIKAADDAYNALSDYEKSLVDEDAKKALDDAKAALAELNKPVDPSSPATGHNSNMFLWIALLFISCGAVITLTVVDRKRKAVVR